jgi:hypothetical protein
MALSGYTVPIHLASMVLRPSGEQEKNYSPGKRKAKGLTTHGVIVMKYRN